LEEKLEPRLAEAKSGKRKVFFVDAAHFVMGSFLGYLWTIARIFVPSSSGRKRYNVLGALDAITHELVTVCNDNYTCTLYEVRSINALSICELLQKIRDSVGVREIITLVLDNAAYQRCTLVTELAKDLKIELLFLPSYSPNLNLIERLWRFIRKDCLNSKYFEHFDDLKYTINQSLLMVSHGKKKEEMKNLMTLKFQLYDNAIYERG